jgi:hypothetical protein
MVMTEVVEYFPPFVLDNNEKVAMINVVLWQGFKSESFLGCSLL